MILGNTSWGISNCSDMDILIIFPLILGLFLLQRNNLITRLYEIDTKVTPNFFDYLMGMHFMLWIVYLIYISSNLSDSGEYYRKASELEAWTPYFKSGTSFIFFVTYPFASLFGISYYSVMLIFSFIGFQGIVLFYFAAKEQLKPLPIFFGGMTVLEALFLLPNLHFWTSSIGKGSVMVFSIGLAMFGLSRFNKRFQWLALGSFLIFMGRSHIFLALLMGLVLGVFLTGKGIRWYIKFPMILLTSFLMLFVSDDVVELTGMESINLFDSQRLTHRASELSKGTSGVDITKYSQAMKLFTFLFRPLFVDAPGMLGIITSFENLILLVMAVIIIKNLPKLWGRMNGYHKSALFFFLLAAITLAQVSGNLGIAMRQKSQLIPMFFTFYAYVRSLLANPETA